MWNVFCRAPFSRVGPRAREFTTAAHRNGDGNNMSNNVRPTRHINPLTDELGDLCARRRLTRQIGTQCTSRVTFSESTERLLYEAYNILLYSVRGRYVTWFWCGRERGIFYFFFVGIITRENKSAIFLLSARGDGFYRRLNATRQHDSSLYTHPRRSTLVCVYACECYNIECLVRVRVRVCLCDRRTFSTERTLATTVS